MASCNGVESVVVNYGTDEFVYRAKLFAEMGAWKISKSL